jgi:hypothetical protein
LGIGDWAQSPIPNPQSPIPNPQSPFLEKLVKFYILKIKINSLNYSFIKFKNDKFMNENSYFYSLL